jgi:hypothetical protein
MSEEEKSNGSVIIFVIMAFLALTFCVVGAGAVLFLWGSAVHVERVESVGEPVDGALIVTTTASSKIKRFASKIKVTKVTAVPGGGYTVDLRTTLKGVDGVTSYKFELDAADPNLKVTMLTQGRANPDLNSWKTQIKLAATTTPGPVGIRYTIVYKTPSGMSGRRKGTISIVLPKLLEVAPK